MTEEQIKQSLTNNSGNIAATARELNVPRTTLQKVIMKKGLANELVASRLKGFHSAADWQSKYERLIEIFCDVMSGNIAYEDVRAIEDMQSDLRGTAFEDQLAKLFILLRDRIDNR
jgi:hypothetical protein